MILTRTRIKSPTVDSDTAADVNPLNNQAETENNLFKEALSDVSPLFRACKGQRGKQMEIEKQVKGNNWIGLVVLLIIFT